MFEARYFPRSYYPERYFPSLGAPLDAIGRGFDLRWSVAPTAERIHRALFTSPVSYSFRFERRTKTYQFLDDVTSVFIADRCQVDLNNDRDILRTATFEIDANARDERGQPITIDPLRDIIAVTMVLLVDGSYWLDIPMGLFQLVEPEQSFQPGGSTMRVRANDLAIHLQQATTTETYIVEAGENYITGTGAVTDILTAHGLAHSLPVTAATLPVDMSWPPGTPWLRVVNDLLHGCNMYSLWFDERGVARSRERDDLSERTPDVEYSGDDFVLAPLTASADLTRFANQVVVVVDDPNREPLYAVATNADPDSPTSTVNLGRTITKTLRGDRAADQATLDAIALSELRQSASLYRRMRMLTSIDPRRTAHEVYLLTVDDASPGERWWCRNWRLTLATGAQMQHEIAHVEKVAS